MAPTPRSTGSKSPRGNDIRRREGRVIQNHIPDTSKPGREHTALLPVELQQRILNIYTVAFPLSDFSDVTSTIQEIKDALYHRDFARAFGDPKFLQPYALRWSASRALAYAHILTIPFPWLLNGDLDQAGPSLSKTALKVTCIGGGGGAELVASAAALRDIAVSSPPFLDVTIFDIADWCENLQKLQTALTAAPTISKYASQSVKDSNQPLIDPTMLTMRFIRQDVLGCDEGTMGSMLRDVSLVTIMFTLNELFTTSVARATSFLMTLTNCMGPKCRLLVVDSPGSYSEVKLGKVGETKRYPMKWLLDHVLIDVVGEGKWQKEVAEDSLWFRLDPRLRYPVELENMRYQMHVYRRERETV